MRQIFTSQRLETVEGVARLLEENGIQTYTSHARSYKGNRRSRFSYAKSGGAQPGVWIVHADDLVRARNLLREAGLLETTRNPSYIMQPLQPVRDGGNLALRIRIGLLVIASAAAAVIAWRTFVGG